MALTTRKTQREKDEQNTREQKKKKNRYDGTNVHRLSQRENLN